MGLIEEIARIIHEGQGYEKWPEPECTQCMETARKIFELMEREYAPWDPGPRS